MLTTFDPEGVYAINGVLKYFRDKNILDRYVTPFSTDTFMPHENSSNFLDITNGLFWASIEDVNVKYVGFNLKHHFLKISHYTIRQYVGGGYATKSWKLQGKRKEGWIDIDVQNSSSFCKEGILPTFEVSGPTIFFNSFRMISEGLSCLDSNYFRTAGIELFGTLCFRTLVFKVDKSSNLLDLVLLIIISS